VPRRCLRGDRGIDAGRQFRGKVRAVDEYHEQHQPVAAFAKFGAGATVFSAAQECRLLFGIDPFERAFVEDHAERVAEMVLTSIERRK
jgi:hypothetical protein